MNSGGAFVSAGDLRLKVYSTLVIFLGSLLSVLIMPGTGDELTVYRLCAYVMGATLGIAIAIEATGGVRSLLRVDIVVLLSLYFLTYLEFLHPNVRILYQQETGAANFACALVQTGFVGIAFGRHVSWGRKRNDSASRHRIMLPELSPRSVVIAFFVFFFLGYFYVLLMTSFNIFDIAGQLMRPRFTRSWARGAVGDWRSALTELSLLLYLVAALGGYILAHSRKFPVSIRIAVMASLFAMLSFDFAEGTRYVVLLKIGLFLMTFFISSEKQQNLRIILLSAAGFVAFWLASGYMLDFRQQGLGRYMEAVDAGVSVDDGFAIDNNLISIARVAQVFPETYPYPGSDVVVQVFTKWIPRFLWPGKPTDWGVSIDEALATGGAYTLALTYVGEAYLIAGLPSLIIVSLIIGALASAWTRVGTAARTNLDLVFYASGFFAAALAMRSMQFVTVAMVPTVALYLLGRYLARRSNPRRVARSSSRIATALNRELGSGHLPQAAVSKARDD